MALTPEQILCAQEWNKLIEEKAKTALGAELGGDFTAANYAAGFNYHVKLTDYNSRSLKALDALVVFKDGVNYLDSSYSNFYMRVIQKIKYHVSKKDEQLMNKEKNEQEALIASIINSYKQSCIDDVPMKDPNVPKIIERIKQFTGVSYKKVNIKEYPYLSPLCNLLKEFERKAVHTAKIMNLRMEADDSLEQIVKHIKEPDDDNGGLKTEKGYVCGWDNLKEPVQLLESLEGGRTIKIDISASHFYGKKSHLNFKNDVHIDVPANWFFNLGADHHDEYDVSKCAKDGAEMAISITYDGVTIVPANPTELSADHSEGWYSKYILNETAAKTGKDVTGYQFEDGEFDTETLFGEEGTLRRMRTLVISQHPIVKLHFKKFDCDKLKKQFDETTNADFELFGGIISGNHKNGYEMSECKIDKSSDSLDVTFTPQPLGSSGTAANQTAYVLGGVIDYVENKAEVKKIRIIEDEVGVSEGGVTLSEELKGLKVVYRKNKDGEYELAGLYNEKEDEEDMVGDNVAVPITSCLACPPVKPLSKGTEIYNVLGSTGDYYDGKKCNNWIGVWEDVLKKNGIKVRERMCSVCGKNKDLVGAHVVKDKKKVNPKDNDVLYIVPLCKGHNNKPAKTAMSLGYEVTAMCLTRFMKKF